MTSRHGQRAAKPSPYNQASEAELASRAALPPSASDLHSLPPSAVPASSAHVNARRAASASAVTTLGGASNGLRARSRNGSWSFRRNGVKRGGSQGRSPSGIHGDIYGGSDGGISSGIRSLSGLSGIFGKRRDTLPDSGPLRPSFHGGMVRLVSHNFPDIPLEEMKSDALWGKTWWWFGRVLDPRTTRMKRWMRFVALVHSASLAVDPCFLYLISYSPDVSCLFLETIFSIVLMVLRSACDLVFLVDAFLSLRTAYVSKEAIARGHGSEMVTNARKIARSRCSLGGVVFDIIATLPIPQVFVWVIAPMLIQMDKASYEFSTGGVTITFSAIILQYVLKLILAARFTVRAQRVNGYIFGAAWWGFALNFIAYIIAAHVFGSLWYLLASERVATCFQTLCQQVPTSVCNPNYVTCPEAYETTTSQVSPAWAAWGSNATLETTCFEGDGTFNFGIYHMALQLMKDGSAVAKIFYGLFFGIMTLSSFGNALVPSTNFVETTFAVIMVLSGLMLFTLLIGNIQVFLHSITSRMEEMQLRRQDLTWWMNRHQLPPGLQRRVLRQEQQNFTATRGIDEEGLIRSMPKSLRRDIKRHLCLDLVKQVPLFQVVDSAALDAVCERLKPLILIHGTEIVRQGEPVCMMLFLIRGTIRSTHTMSHGTASSCLIRDGYFYGEELLSWGLGQSPDTNQLPSATATLTTVTAVEGFVLEAEDLLFVTTHFKFNWKSQRIQRWVRYYSPHWRTWAALTIQIAWRRHVARQHATSLQRSLDAHADVDVCGGQLTTDTPSGAPPASAATAPAPVPVPATATATTIDTPTTAPISSTAPLDPALTTTATEQGRGIPGDNGGGGTRLGRPRMDVDEIEALQRRDRMRLYNAIFSSPKPRGSMDKNP